MYILYALNWAGRMCACVDLDLVLLSRACFHLSKPVALRKYLLCWSCLPAKLSLYPDQAWSKSGSKRSIKFALLLSDDCLLSNHDSVFFYIIICCQSVTRTLTVCLRVCYVILHVYVILIHLEGKARHGVTTLAFKWHHTILP